MSNKLVDFYEVLELSPNASPQTLERVFRFLAKQFHPDVAADGNAQRFTQIVEAYEALRDPPRRAAYDQELIEQKRQAEELVRESKKAESDTTFRIRLLTMFYAKRKRDMRNPGLGIATLEQAFQIPLDELEFHLWYFREKGWIDREESGLLSITADGVDRIEQRFLQDRVGPDGRLTDGVPRLPNMSPSQNAGNSFSTAR